MYLSRFNHSLTVWHLDCQVWAITNAAARNSHVQMFVWRSIFFSLWQMLGYMIELHVKFLRETAQLFPRVTLSFYTPTTERSSVSASMPAYGVVTFQKLLAILVVGVRWYLVVVLTCISLMTNYAEHHVMCLFASVYPRLPWNVSFCLLPILKLDYLLLTAEFWEFFIQTRY